MFFPYFTSTEREWEYRQKVPWVVPSLILACVMIHCYLNRYLGADAQSDLYYCYGVVPAQLGWGRWYTPFTCTLLHGGWLHLAGNCYFLWLYGISMERLLGSARFLVLYGGGALISMWVQVWTLPTVMMDLPTIGASGAISAVLGGFFVLMPGAKVRCLLYCFIRPLFIPLPACIVLGSWFLLQLFSSMDSSLSEQGIAFWAHVGGVASGTMLATGLYQLVQHEARRRETQLQSHLDKAWKAFIQGREREARESLHQFRLAVEDRYVAEQPLLTGLLHYHDQPDPEEGAAFFYHAFQRGVDRMDKGAAMTAYLQMIEFLPAKLIPAEIHRDGAYVALSCCQPVLALAAMEKAFEGELDEGGESLLQRAEAVLRNMLDMPEEAGRMAELTAVHGGRQGLGARKQISPVRG